MHLIRSEVKCMKALILWFCELYRRKSWVPLGVFLVLTDLNLRALFLWHSLIVCIWVWSTLENQSRVGRKVLLYFNSKLLISLSCRCKLKYSRKNSFPLIHCFNVLSCVSQELLCIPNTVDDILSWGDNLCFKAP